MGPIEMEVRRYPALMDGVRLADGTIIPERELMWRFDPSGGPGGQHANRSATRAELTFDASASTALSDRQKTRIRAGLGPRSRSGVVT